jgi:enoyl-[acyl-carrier protein] reductase III
MSELLDGRWALILGVSSGMGRAAAEAWVGRGGNLAGVHFDSGAGRERAEELERSLQGGGADVHFFNLNAASKATRETLIPELVGMTGEDGLGMILHSLAFGSLAPLLGRRGEAITEKQMDMTLRVMAHSLVYWVQDLRLAGLLGAGSRIFAMTSAGAQRLTPNYGAVSAAKCALESHVRQLALELAPEGVAVNAIRAGVTVTPSLQQLPEHAELSSQAQRANPHGRLTTPADVAEAIVLLAAAPSSWMTGNVIGVDGGEILPALLRSAEQQ